jgi:integrase/recombinase XerD
MKKEHSKNIDLLRQEMEFRNYSQRSIDTYCEIMATMENELKAPVDSVSLETFKSYLRRLVTAKNLSVSTVNQNISAYKILQVDILKREWENFKVTRPRRTIKLPVVLSVNEVERLLAATKNIKHRAMLMLAYSAGLRRMEVQQIRPSSIDSKRMQIRIVQGKGKKDRYSILSPKLLQLLRTYYRLYRPVKYLFESQVSEGKPLADTTIHKIVKSNATKAGIKKDISFHTLRHSFATHLLESGVNIKLIQQLLGHNSLRTTSVYLHLTNASLANVISPLEGMNV